MKQRKKSISKDRPIAGNLTRQKTKKADHKFLKGYLRIRFLSLKL